MRNDGVGKRPVTLVWGSIIAKKILALDLQYSASGPEKPVGVAEIGVTAAQDDAASIPGQHQLDVDKC